MTEPVIELDHVSKRFRIPLDRSNSLKYRLTHPRTTSRYRTLSAVDDVSFAVERGEFVGIIGHNGSGKSTLLKILARIYSVSEGSMRVGGLVSPFLELGVGFNPELTARENVFLGGAVLGLTRRFLTRKFDEIIEFAELEQFADQKLKNFSSGMQVRLAFSLAIQSYADILLMDEVLAVGDARFQSKCFDVFARYKREGKTIILVTHDLGAVSQYCDRVILMDHGKLIADGEPQNVITEYKRRIGELGNIDNGSPLGGEEHLESTSATYTIQHVLLTTEDNVRPNMTFFTDAPFEIHVHVGNNGATSPDIACRLALSRLDGTLLATSDFDGRAHTFTAPERGGSVHLAYELPKLPLLEGSYSLSVDLFDPMTSDVYDSLTDTATFHVLDEHQRAGMMSIPGNWSIRSLSHSSPTQPTHV